MSVTVMALVWNRRIEFRPPAGSRQQGVVPAVQKLVALKLADHAGDDGGHVHPSAATIALKCGLSRSSVMAALRLFRDAGLIVEVERRAKGVVEYRVDLAILAALPGAEAGQGTCPAAGHVRGTDTNLSVSRTPTCPAAGHKTSIEPSKEPSVERSNERSVDDGFEFTLTAGEALSPASDLQKAVDAWNVSAASCGLQPVKKLTDVRRRKLRARLAAHGLDGWEEALAKVRASPFLRGETRQGGWRASFDWIISEGNFLKIHEGNYDDTSPAGPSQQQHGQARRSPAATLIAAFGAVAGQPDRERS